MRQIFHSHGCSYNVEYFHSDKADMVRFYAAKNELYSDLLSNLVIVEPSYGYLLLQYIGNMIQFLEDSFPKIKNVYMPYHINFFSVDDYDEYNGEY